MNETVQLLQDVVRNARTGEAAIDHLLEKTEGDTMRRELITEKALYHSSVRSSESALVKAGGHPEPIGPMARMGMWMGINMNTLTDRSDSHIAEIMIQGANMGIVEMTKSMNTYENADPNAKSIASNFIGQQKNIIDRQKPFLVDKIDS